MFWWKKKEESNKEINFMFCRLMNLSYKLRSMTYEGCYKSEGMSAYGTPLQTNLTVETALGIRDFVLTYSENIPYSRLSYGLRMFEVIEDPTSEKAWTSLYLPSKRIREIFEIQATKDFNTVKPMMRVGELTAHEIDLAVYELEQIVEKYYKLYKQEKQFHELELCKLMVRGGMTWMKNN